MNKRKTPRWVRDLEAQFVHSECSERCAAQCELCGEACCKYILIDGECPVCFKAHLVAFGIDVMTEAKDRCIQRLEAALDEETRFPAKDE